MQLSREKDKIRELTIDETEAVAGGIGQGVFGLFSPANIAAAGRLVTGVSYLGGAFSLGYAIGSFGYSTYSRYKFNTP